MLLFHFYHNTGILHLKMTELTRAIQLNKTYEIQIMSFLIKMIEIDTFYSYFIHLCIHLFSFCILYLAFQNVFNMLFTNVQVGNCRRTFDNTLCTM